MADGVRTQIEEWAEEERRLGLHNTHGRMINESLEEALKKPIRTIRQQSSIQQQTISSREHQTLMSEKTTSDLDPD